MFYDAEAEKAGPRKQAQISKAFHISLPLRRRRRNKKKQEGRRRRRRKEEKKRKKKPSFSINICDDLLF